MNALSDILIKLVAIVIAITVHEFAHAYSAHLLGDDTAKMDGRMTLDPAKHLDPIGIIMMLVFRIGWARPVPVNPNNFKNYRVGNVIVSLSGALGNILTAIVCMMLVKVVHMDAINSILWATIGFNVSFAAFNLLPLPPLDGWGVISSFIPYKYNEFVYKYESMSNVIFLLLILTKFHVIIMAPIYNVIVNIVYLFA